MIIVLAAIAVGLAALPGVLRPFGRRLHPADWARAAAFSFVAALVTSQLSLLFLAAPVLLRAAGAHGLAAACARMAGQLVPGGAWMGWSAAAGAVVFPVMASFGFRRARLVQRGLAELALIGRRATVAGFDVVVIDDARPIAVSVDAYGGVIVISSGLVEELHDEELVAVLRHEVAHLDHRHHRLLQLAAATECAVGFLPWVRAGVGSLRCAIERWADEDAAGHDWKARVSTRRALVRVAVGVLPVDAAAFGGLSTVVERLAALEVPPPAPSRARRVVMSAPLATLGAGALFSVVMIATHVWLVLTMPVLCAT